MNRRTAQVTVDDIQRYLSCHVTLLPSLYDSYIQTLFHLERQGKLTILPSIRLELYSTHIQHKISKKELISNHY